MPLTLPAIAHPPRSKPPAGDGFIVIELGAACKSRVLIYGGSMDNRQINAMVAEKVMGWKPENIAISSSGARADVWRREDGTVEFCRDWKPTEDIAAAWQIKAKITKSGEWGFYLHNDGNGWSEARFIHNDDKGYWAEADTDEVAICLAALKAVGVEIAEDEQ